MMQTTCQELTSAPTASAAGFQGGAIESSNHWRLDVGIVRMLPGGVAVVVGHPVIAGSAAGIRRKAIVW